VLRGDVDSIAIQRPTVEHNLQDDVDFQHARSSYR